MCFNPAYLTLGSRLIYFTQDSTPVRAHFQDGSEEAADLLELALMAYTLARSGTTGFSGDTFPATVVRRASVAFQRSPFPKSSPALAARFGAEGVALASPLSGHGRSTGSLPSYPRRV